MFETEVTPAGAVQVPDEVNITSCVVGGGGGGGGVGPGGGGVGGGGGAAENVPAPRALATPRVTIVGTARSLDELSQ